MRAELRFAQKSEGPVRKIGTFAFVMTNAAKPALPFERALRTSLASLLE
jgi:hypothetical protein